MRRRNILASFWSALSLVILLSGTGSALAARPQLLLTTENYPPFNMQQDDANVIVGISTDIVREIMKRAGVSYAMKFLPWQRAYNMALKTENTCVFSTTETEARKPKFKWVGPLVQNDWIFFARPDSEITISSLEDARGYRVGGYKGDAVALFLEQQGFRLDLASHDHVNPGKLTAGRFDLWATGAHLGPYLARQAGVAIEPLFTFRETVMSLACNVAVEDELIADLNRILSELRVEGVVSEILARYR